MATGPVHCLRRVGCARRTASGKSTPSVPHARAACDARPHRQSSGQACGGMHAGRYSSGRYANSCLCAMRRAGCVTRAPAWSYMDSASGSTAPNLTCQARGRVCVLGGRIVSGTFATAGPWAERRHERSSPRTFIPARGLEAGCMERGGRDVPPTAAASHWPATNIGVGGALSSAAGEASPHTCETWRRLHGVSDWIGQVGGPVTKRTGVTSTAETSHPAISTRSSTHVGRGPGRGKAPPFSHYLPGVTRLMHSGARPGRR